MNDVVTHLYSIEVPEDEVREARAAHTRVDDAVLALGQEREAFLHEEAALEEQLADCRAQYRHSERRLVEEIEARRQNYAGLVRRLAHRHLDPKRPGKFDFRPELGAFVQSGRDDEQPAALSGREGAEE